MKLDKIKIAFKEVKWLKMDVDTKMKLKILKYLYLYIIWNKKDMHDAIFWVYRLDTSPWIDYLADFMIENFKYK